jgi:RNA polymerase sigma-54 factor
MKINSSLLLEQKQAISQTQIQALELLAMDHVELDSFLQNEYLENPLLEYQTGSEIMDEINPSKDWYQVDTSRQYNNEYSSDQEDNEGQFEAPANDEELVRDFVMNQLNLKKYSTKELKIIDYLIDCLDDTGLLTMPLDEIAKTSRSDIALVKNCLHDLQLLEPYGLFAPDLSHCLLRQLEVLGINDNKLNKIILDYLDEVGSGKISTISRCMELTTLQVRKYIAIIETLNPKPLSGFVPGSTAYTIPDIILLKTQGQWEVILNDRFMGDYQLSDYYLNLMETAKDKELQEYFSAKAQRAKFLLKSLEQRRTTLLKLGEALLEWQKPYFNGTGDLISMTMADIADRMGVHVSTVSRCVKGKYLQCPRKSILIKTLFSTSETDSVKNLLREIVENEDKKKPYSDQAVKELLEERQISISRRVIAKYREELGIKGSFERKQL